MFFSIALHDKPFETNKENSDKIDKSITLLYKTIDWPVEWVDKSDEFNFFFSTFSLLDKIIFDLLVFCL